VSSGAGEAEEFSFEGGEARLGRTADNDVVIKDPSSSRSHARVFEEDGRYFVEDMKSANGTRLNGKPVKGVLELKSGDQVSIGDVVLDFTSPETNDTVMGAGSTLDESSVDDGGEDPNATMLKPPPPAARPSQAIKRSPTQSRKAVAAPPPEPEEEPAEEEEALNDPPDENSTRNFEVPPPRSIQRRGAAAAPVRARPAADEEGDDAPVALSAAERARQRRELAKSSTGRAVLLWGDLPLPGKIVVGAMGLGLAAALIAGIAMVVIPKKVVKKIETDELAPNSEAIGDSFGLGDEVDFERPDQKSFTFSYASPTSIVGVLHYYARDISKDEVTIELNGSPLGSVPADTVDPRSRQLEVVLPSTQLKLNEPNELVFDNVNNPPGDDPWVVWGIWVEIIPVPQLSADEAARRVKEELERAGKLYEMRAIGAMNLFRSWKEYRDAWLLLEATPDRPPELLQIARTRMTEIRPELDRKCSAMLVDYQKVINQKYPDFTAARSVLQNIPAHFEKEHPCYGMSRYLMRGLEDLSGRIEE
jgi:pSer/pThr/pTyr-binding forkhead associated (FHA) protein